MVLYLSFSLNVRVWIIADLHLFCDKYREPDGTERLIDFWKNNISEGDWVFILGDGCFKYKKCKKLFSEDLKGIKVLIKGNHDHWGRGKLWQLGYDYIVDDGVVIRYKVGAKKVYTFYLTHRYMSKSELKKKFPFKVHLLIHGHSHKRRQFIDGTVPALNACPEWADYEFLTLDDIVAILQGIDREKKGNTGRGRKK